MTGKRKLFAFIAGLACITSLAVVDAPGLEHAVGAIVALAGLYFAGNVGEHVSDAWSARGTTVETYRDSGAGVVSSSRGGIRGEDVPERNP